MKIKENLLNATLVLIIIAVVTVILFKFVLTGDHHDHNAVSIENPDQISLIDMHGNSIKFPDVVDSDRETYLLIFEMTNCYTCIFDGIGDLIKLKKAGKNCLTIAVHDQLIDVSGWSATHDFTPFYMLKKVDFYEHIRCSKFPVMVKLKNGVPISHRFIEP